MGIFTIRSHAGQGLQVTHGPIGHARLSERDDVAAVGFPVVARNEAVQRLANHVRGFAAEHFFGGRVEDRDVLFGIHRDDGIHGRVDNPGEHIAAFPQFPGGIFPPVTRNMRRCLRFAARLLL